MKECSVNKCSNPVSKNDKCYIHNKIEDKKKSKYIKKKKKKGGLKKSKKVGKKRLIPLPALDKLVWKFCSIAYRLEDCDSTGMVKCATCPSELYYFGTKKLHMGHFVSRRFKATKFLRTNMASQCFICNGPVGRGREYLMGTYLNEKHGPKTAELMQLQAQISTKFDRQDYKIILLDMCKRIHKESNDKNLFDWENGLLKQELNLLKKIIEDGFQDIPLEIGKFRIP